MPKPTRRPAVELTVGRMNHNGCRPDPLQTVQLNRVMIDHDQPNRDTLTYACLECGSIGESESKEARDTNVTHFDFTCHPGRTVIFHTESI